MIHSTQRHSWRIALVSFCVCGATVLAGCGAQRDVNEPFPAPAEAAAPAPTTMAEKPTEAAMAEKPTEPAMAEKPTEATMAEKPTEVAMAEQPTAASAGPAALKVGNFVTGGVANDTADGTATIYKLEDGSQTLRLENFSATPGPDLFVVLSGTANPAGDGVKGGAYLELAALKGTSGNQNYELPADFDASQYNSVSIWCRTFNVVFGYAALK